MHPVSLIASAIKQDKECPVLPIVGTRNTVSLQQCAITGLSGQCIPRKELLGKSFTNHDVLSAPHSAYVSIDAYRALKYKWERMTSWFCDGTTFVRLNRLGVRDKVFQAEMPEKWAAYATTSYKKHGALYAKVNTGNRRVWLFEMRLVDLSDKNQVDEWWQALNAALRAGIGRSVLESLVCPPFLIGKIGLKRWMEFEQWAQPKYSSALYAFLCYLLPSQEELKLESHAVETPRQE